MPGPTSKRSAFGGGVKKTASLGTRGILERLTSPDRVSGESFILECVVFLVNWDFEDFQAFNNRNFQWNYRELAVAHLAVGFY